MNKKIIIGIISVILVIIISILLFIFINNKNNNHNNNSNNENNNTSKEVKISTMVASKTNGDNFEETYIEENIIQFENDIATTINTVYTFNTKEIADYVFNFMTSLQEDKEHNSDFEIQRESDLVIKSTNSIKSFVNYKNNFTETYKKDEIKAWHIEQGFTIISEQ
jgi:competence protein ComGC